MKPRIRLDRAAEIDPGRLHAHPGAPSPAHLNESARVLGAGEFTAMPLLGTRRTADVRRRIAGVRRVEIVTPWARAPIGVHVGCIFLVPSTRGARAAPCPRWIGV